MNTYERIIQLLNEKNISKTQLMKDLALGNGIFTQWQNGKAKPSHDVLIKIAKYFNVSTDYLLGLSNNKGIVDTESSYVEIAPQVTKTDNHVIALARGGEKVQYDLSESEMQAILNLLDSMKKEK